MVWSLALRPDDAKQDPVVYGTKFGVVFLAEDPVPCMFPCSADHEQDWQPYPVDPYSAICDDRTCSMRVYFFHCI